MGDLEHVAARKSRRDEPALDQGVDVAGEQDARRLGERHRDEEDDRLAVGRPFRLGAEAARRPHGAHLVARPAQEHVAGDERPGARRAGRTTPGPGAGEQRLGHVERSGHDAGRNVAQHGGQSARVIAIAVRGHDRGETNDAARAERGEDGARPLVGPRPGVASVDQDRSAVGQRDEERVALADVEHGDDERARIAASAGRPWHDQGEGCSGGGNDREHRDRAAAGPPRPGHGERDEPQDEDRGGPRRGCERNQGRGLAGETGGDPQGEERTRVSHAPEREGEAGRPRRERKPKDAGHERQVRHRHEQEVGEQAERAHRAEAKRDHGQCDELGGQGRDQRVCDERPEPLRPCGEPRADRRGHREQAPGRERRQLEARVERPRRMEGDEPEHGERQRLGAAGSAAEQAAALDRRRRRTGAPHRGRTAGERAVRRHGDQAQERGPAATRTEKPERALEHGGHEHDVHAGDGEEVKPADPAQVVAGRGIESAPVAEQEAGEEGPRPTAFLLAHDRQQAGPRRRHDPRPEVDRRRPREHVHRRGNEARAGTQAFDRGPGTRVEAARVARALESVDAGERAHERAVGRRPAAFEPRVEARPADEAEHGRSADHLEAQPRLRPAGRGKAADAGDDPALGHRVGSEQARLGAVARDRAGGGKRRDEGAERQDAG